MSEIVKHCPNCGAANEESSTFCRHCYASLFREQPVATEQLEGIDKSDWHDFIDKNASHYVDAFAGNEGKKVFFHMNWSAFFFNIYWMCYRKMYLYAVIFLAVTTLFTLGLATTVVTAYKPAIDELNQSIEPYEQYMMDGSTSGLLAAATDGTVNVNEVLDAMRQYQDDYNAILFKIGFWLLAPSLLLNLLFGLLADCLYRRYVRRHIGLTEGGTSVLATVIAILVYPTVNELVLGPLVTLLVEGIL